MGRDTQSLALPEVHTARLAVGTLLAGQSRHSPPGREPATPALSSRGGDTADAEAGFFNPFSQGPPWWWPLSQALGAKGVSNSRKMVSQLLPFPKKVPRSGSRGAVSPGEQVPHWVPPCSGASPRLFSRLSGGERYGILLREWVK